MSWPLSKESDVEPDHTADLPCAPLSVEDMALELVLFLKS